MLRRLVPALLVLPLIASAQPAPDLRARLKQAMQRLAEGDRKLEDYGYVRRVERAELGADNKVVSQKSWVTRRQEENGIMVGRLVERDGKPLPEDERRKMEQDIQKAQAEWRALTPAQRRQKREEDRRKESEQDAWIQELPEALECRQVGEEAVQGRPALALDCSPRPSYKPTNMRARVFQKLRGKLWIDKTDTELVRADAEVFETVNIGFGLLGRIDKGTRFRLERVKAPGNAWLPQTQAIEFAARVMVFKSMHNRINVRYTDYRPRTSPAGE